MGQRENESVGTMLSGLEGGWDDPNAAPEGASDKDKAKDHAAPGPKRTASDALRAAVQPEGHAKTSSSRPPPPGDAPSGGSGSRPPGPITRGTVRMLRPELPNTALAALTPEAPEAGSAEAPASLVPPVTVSPVVDVGAMPSGAPPAGAPLPRTTKQMATVDPNASSSKAPSEPPTTAPTGAAPQHSSQPSPTRGGGMPSTTLIIATPASIVPPAPAALSDPGRSQALVPVSVPPEEPRWHAPVGPVPPPRPQLPPQAGPLDERLVLLTEPESARSVAFRLLRDNLIAKGLPRILAVAGTAPGDGATTCAVNLALALAEHPTNRVLLVDGNFIAPSLARIFSMDGFSPPNAADAALVPLKLGALMPRFHVAAIVKRNGEPAPRFDKIRFGRILEHLAKLGYDHIVIDAGALRPGAPAGSLVTSAEATLLAVRAGRTTARAVRQASGQIPPGRAIGVTLVDDEPTE